MPAPSCRHRSASSPTRPGRPRRRAPGRAAGSRSCPCGRAAADPELARLDDHVLPAEEDAGGRRRRRGRPVPGSGSSPVQTEHRPHGLRVGVVQRLLQELHQAALAVGVARASGRPRPPGPRAARPIRPRRKYQRLPVGDPARPTALDRARRRPGSSAADSSRPRRIPVAASRAGSDCGSRSSQGVEDAPRPARSSGMPAVAKYSQIRSSASAGTQHGHRVVQRPAGPADLLVVGDRRGRRAEVDAEGQVGLVVAHAERRGRDQRLDLVVAQPVLELARGSGSAPSRPRRRCPRSRRKPATRSVSATVST